MTKNKMLLITLGCYALLLLCWLVRGGYLLFYDGTHAAQDLPLAKAELVEVEQAGKGEYLTLGTDGQLVFEDLDLTGRRVVLEGEFEQYAGELDLYYKKADQSDFSVNQRVFARPLTGGGYEYLLPPGHYTGLRLDTGTEAGNTLRVEALTFGQGDPAHAYFVPSLCEGLAFLALPALASCAIYTIMEGNRYRRARREKNAAKRGQNG
ncbi:hypothetical protein LJC49_00495 [Ruminococcaceae bacterium OttesenSCG-928-I18]|nr:hypothetical protein [Ruminococcaceae bacterium OttesenSCG-928-I18]